MGGNPVRSYATRRTRVSRSASGEYSSDLASSAFSRNASIGLEILAARSGFATRGTGGFFGVRNAQKSRSCWLTSRSGVEPATSTTTFTSGAPAAIQPRIVSNSPASTGRIPKSTRSFGGGMSRSWIFLTSRLASGFPGTMAGPDLPPLSIARRVLRSSPPFFSRPPWQTTQRVNRIGSTSSWVRAALALKSPPRVLAPARTHAVILFTSALVGRFFPSGGMLPSASTSTSRLFSGFPGITTAPDSLPRRMPPRLPKSSEPLVLPPAWQRPQRATSSGRISVS